MLPATAGSGLPVLVTARSARVTTPVGTVAWLLSGLGSVVVLPAVAVLLMVEPACAPALTMTTSRKVALAPAGSVALVALTVPVPPTGGVVSVNAGPIACAAATKVVL